MVGFQLCKLFEVWDITLSPTALYALCVIQYNCTQTVRRGYMWDTRFTCSYRLCGQHPIHLSFSEVYMQLHFGGQLHTFTFPLGDRTMRYNTLLVFIFDLISLQKIFNFGIHYSIHYSKTITFQLGVF